MTDLFPPGVRERLTQARSLLVVLQDRLPDHLRAELVRARQRGAEVEVLFDRFRDGGYLNDLYGEGVRLFETALPGKVPSLLFLDRREGWTLPAWSPLRDAHTRVHELLWRRVAVALRVEGRVKGVKPEAALVELDTGRPVFLDVRGRRTAPPLREEEMVRVLGIVDFLGLRGAALVLHPLHVEPAREETATPGPRREGSAPISP